MTDAGTRAEEIDTSKPQSARMYDYFLDGKDNYPVDWEAAEQVISFFPAVKEMARTNRDFMHRAARLLARRGIRQFLDIGTGIPTAPNLHQIVQAITPDARVVYADNDPIVLRHAEALLHSDPQGRTAYIQADAQEPQKILAAARQTLDFDQPVALSMMALLHLVGDEDDPYGIVAELLDSLAPGSYLALSHATGDFDPQAWERVVEVYRKGELRRRSDHALNSPASSTDLSSSTPASNSPPSGIPRESARTPRANRSRSMWASPGSRRGHIRPPSRAVTGSAADVAKPNTSVAAELLTTRAGPRRPWVRDAGARTATRTATPLRRRSADVESVVMRGRAGPGVVRSADAGQPLPKDSGFGHDGASVPVRRLYAVVGLNRSPFPYVE